VTDAARDESQSLRHYRETFVSATRTLGGQEQEETFSRIKRAGDASLNPRRLYHTLAHFQEISAAAHLRLLEDMAPFQEEFRKLGLMPLYDVVVAVMVRAGAHHDIIYHVDRDYIPADILRDETFGILPPRSIDAPHSDYVVTSAEPPGEAGVIVDMARVVFDVLPRDILTQFGGKNEFLSAVYAGLQGWKEGIPLKYLLAEMAMIEATRPFDPPDRLARLRIRFESANRLLPAASQLDREEMDAFLLGAAQLANVDVLDFARDFNHFLKGSVNLLLEAGRPVITLEDYFIRARNREAFFLNLLSKLHNGDAAVFHSLAVSRGGESCFPPRGAVEICEKRARENIRKDVLMSRALKVATALSAAIEATYGEGNLDAISSLLEANQAQMLAGYPAMRDPSMMETAMAIRDGAHSIPLLGLASYLLGHLSETSLLRLSEKTSHQFQAYQERFTAAFATRKTARELLEWQGEYQEMAGLETIIAQALGYEEKQQQQAK